jgi:hypothetical protein
MNIHVLTLDRHKNIVGLYLLVYEIPTPLLIIGFLAAMQILANNKNVCRFASTLKEQHTISQK